MNVAFAYSCKDRVNFTDQTFDAVHAEADKFDLFVVDGSRTEDGQKKAFELSSMPRVRKVHTDVGGGADFAILYSLSMMLDAGYDYLGLIENDVLLERGWFDRIFALFEMGYKVGSVSARCYSDRILEFKGDYAVMANIGAGMVLFSRAGAEAVLDYYRSGSLSEYRFAPLYMRGLVAPTPHEASNPNEKYNLSADWFFESSMMARDMVSLACVPSMARSVDQTDEVFQTSGREVSVDDGESPSIIKPPPCFGNFDPEFGFIAQPHHFLSFFRGDCKLTWAKHFGPFGMKMNEGGSLTVPAFGDRMGVLLEMPTGSSLEVSVDGNVMQESRPGLGWRQIGLGDFGKHVASFSFKGCSPSTVMTLSFPVPQPWFKDGYGLRYKSLEGFLS